MKDRSSIRLDNDERAMYLAVKLYDEAEKFLSLFDKMLKKGIIESYSLILTMSNYEDFGNFLDKKKRRSDLLLEIDKESNIYALICSETEVGGGYYFYKRLSDDIYRNIGEEITASVLSVEAKVPDVWELVYDVTAPFIELNFNDLKPQDIVLNRFE